MEAVAHHLQIEALSRRNDGGEPDLFARSAYNRYYYATFLCVREALITLDSGWSRLPHADYPKTLEGQVLKTLQGGKKRAVKIGDSGLITKCQQADRAARQLAKLMRESSAVRVVADYEPSIRVDFADSGRFRLSGVEITDAHRWPLQAKVWTETIMSAWRQVNA